MAFDEETQKLIEAALTSAQKDSLSMSHKGAAVARLRMEFIEPILLWIQKEEDRGTEYYDILNALTYFMAGVVAKISAAAREEFPKEVPIPTGKELYQTFARAYEAESDMERILAQKAKKDTPIS